MNNIKSTVVRAKKKFVSFLCEIFASTKGLGILGYIIICSILWRKFADMALVDTVLHDFQFSWGIMPRLIYHACAVFLAVFLLCMIIYALGACVPDKLAIKRKIPAAKLPESEKTSDPTIFLWIPHRKKFSISFFEIEFLAVGVPVERFEARRLALESALNLTVIGKFEVGDRNDIVKCRAVKGIRVANKNALYDED